MNSEYERERDSLIKWAEKESRKNDKDNLISDGRQDGRHSEEERRIAREFRKKLKEIKTKYGKTE